MKNDNLEQRAVAALSNDGASVTELAELVREVEAALPAAHATAEEARREGADPLLSPDPVLARERVIAAELAYERADSLLPQLETRRRQLAAAERTASWEADYERVKGERDRLAVELATSYPQLVATLVDLLGRVGECEKECDASPRQRLRARSGACSGRSCTRRVSPASRVTRRQSPGICGCQTGNGQPRRRGRRERERC
jgi:hypothetical protein